MHVNCCRITYVMNSTLLRIACLLLIASLGVSHQQRHHRDVDALFSPGNRPHNLSGIVAIPKLETPVTTQTACHFNVGYTATMGIPSRNYEVLCSEQPYTNEQECTSCCELALLGTRSPRLHKGDIKGLMVKLREPSQVQPVPVSETKPEPWELKPLNLRCGCCMPTFL
uniref:Gnk2-homologous domain-containing protein n=1 Tax=Steinernema glaseri TaxID=37863 RepID=A0A1I8AQD2_9BILA